MWNKQIKKKALCERGGVHTERVSYLQSESGSADICRLSLAGNIVIEISGNIGIISWYDVHKSSFREKLKPSLPSRCCEFVTVSSINRALFLILRRSSVQESTTEYLTALRFLVLITCLNQIAFFLTCFLLRGVFITTFWLLSRAFGVHCFFFYFCNDLLCFARFSRTVPHICVALISAA